MSQLQQLKQTVNGLAESARKTAGNLSQFDRTFSQHTSSVQQAIGGSNRGDDKKVLQSLEEAKRKVKEAAQALQVAAKTAAEYGKSL